MFFEIFIQMMPYLAVFAVLGYIGRAQQKKAKEREEEQKKGIIRTCYVVKTEKILTIIFIIGIFFTGGLVVASVIQQEDFFPLFVFGIAFVVFLIGSLNMIMWKLEVNGDKIIWRSTFGKKMTFYFDDITYCERKKGSIRVYVNGEKLFTISGRQSKSGPADPDLTADGSSSRRIFQQLHPGR